MVKRRRMDTRRKAHPHNLHLGQDHEAVQTASQQASQPASRPAQASSPFKTQMSQEPEPALETRSPDLNRQQPELEPKLPQAGCIDIGHKPHT